MQLNISRIRRQMLVTHIKIVTASSPKMIFYIWQRAGETKDSLIVWDLVFLPTVSAIA